MNNMYEDHKKDENLNNILRKVWEINNKIASGEPLSESEKAFYNANLTKIQRYYYLKSEYWRSKLRLI